MFAVFKVALSEEDLQQLTEEGLADTFSRFYARKTRHNVGTYKET